MKRLTTLLIAPAILLTATAADFSQDGIYYTILDAESGIVAVESCNPSLKGNIELPSTIIRKNSEQKEVVYTVGAIADRAFYWTSGLTGVSLPFTLTSIGAEAFLNCSSLNAVILPSALQSIGDFAFSGCSSLKEITIPPSVRNAGNQVFSLSKASQAEGRLIRLMTTDPEIYGPDFLGSNNEATVVLVESDIFENVYMSDQTGWRSQVYPLSFSDGALRYETVFDEADHRAVRILGEEPFASIISIRPQVFSFNVTGYDEKWTLSGNKRVKKISFDAPMRDIPAGFCRNTPSLESVRLAYTLSSIGDEAFADSGLKWITSEGSVPVLGRNVVGERDDKILVNVSESYHQEYLNNERWNSAFEIKTRYEDPSGWHYSVQTGYDMINTVTLLGFEGKPDKEGKLTIPSFLNFLDEMAETVNISLSELPDSIRTLEIESSWLPLKVDCNLGALAGSSLTSLIVGRNLVQGTETQTMFGGSGLTEVIFDDCANKVPPFFLENCTKLKTVDLRGITEIGERAFAGALTLSMRAPMDFLTDSNVEIIGPYAFESVRMSSLTLPETLAIIGEGAFHKCGLLESVTIPAPRSSIGMDAFNLCDRLTTVNIEGEVEIGVRAFFNCSKLATIALPSGATRIGFSAFEKCFALEEADVRAYTVEERAFADCTKLRRLSISGEGFLERGFITDCPNLEEVDLDLPDIGSNGEAERVAVNCPQLTRINFGNNVQTIAASAFRNQLSLREVCFGTGLENIGESAFRETGLERIIFPTLDLPAAKTDIANMAFYRDEYNALHNPAHPDGPFAYDRERLTTVSLGSTVRNVSTDAFKGVVVSSLDLGNSVENLTLDCSGDIETLVLPASLKSLTTATALTVGTLTADYSEEAMEWSPIWDFPVKEFAEINRTILPGLHLEGADGILPELSFGMTEDSEGITASFSPSKNGRGATAAFGAVRLGQGVKTLDLSQVDYLRTDRITFDEGTEEIKGSIDLSSEIEVLSLPSTLKYLDADFIYSGPQSRGGNIRKLIIRDGSGCVTPFGDSNLLRGLEDLEEIYMGLEIEGLRFSNCGNLQKVVVGDMVKAIGTELFRDCVGLTNVIMNDNVTEVRQGAFQGCTGLKVLSMAETLTTIGENAYADCTGIERIVARSQRPAVGAAGFNQVIEESVPLYVPAEVLDDYSFSELFYRFDNILDMSGNVIEDLEVDTEVADKLGHLGEGESLDLGAHVCGSCGQPLPKGAPRRASAFVGEEEERVDPNSFGFYFFTPNPDVLSVDANGVVTVLKREAAEVWVYALDGSDRKTVVAVNNVPAIKGDLNGDGIIDSLDINMLIEHVCAPADSDIDLYVADMDGDGVIDSKDINMLIERCLE